MRILLVADEPCKSYWDYYDESKLKGIDLILSAVRSYMFMEIMMPSIRKSRRKAASILTTGSMFITGYGSWDWAEVSDTDLANISIQRRRCRRGRRKSAFRL